MGYYLNCLIMNGCDVIVYSFFVFFFKILDDFKNYFFIVLNVDGYCLFVYECCFDLVFFCFVFKFYYCG